MTTRTERKPSLILRMIIMLVLVGLLLAALVGWNVMGKIAMKNYMSNQSAPPQTVTSIQAGYDLWQPTQSAIGTLRAVRGAELALDAGGVVSQVNLTSGEEVKEGQLLLRLRDDDDVAKVRQAEAGAALAKVTLDRMQRQLQVKAISQAAYDNAAAEYKSQQAAVQQAQAVVAKKQLRAPFSGSAGIVTVSPGAYLSAGTAIVTLQQLDPVYVDFNVPQRNLGALNVGQRVTLNIDAFGDRVFEGKLRATNPKVDGDTRNVRVEAEVANPDHVLVPGMFANVGVDVGEQDRYLTLPQTAITFNPYGETVFVVTPSDQKDAQGKPALPTAQQVFVTTGTKRGDQVAVLSGIEEGAEVVTSGQLKLKNGTPLIIDNRKPPSNDANPKPQEG